MKFRSFYLITLLLLVFCQSAFSYTKENVMIEMSDGTKLNTNIYYPSEFEGSLPVILLRTTYDADDIPYGDFLLTYAELSGYIVVSQDSRGNYASEGKDSLFLEDGWGFNRDGYETIEWIAGQEWCNGKVGMFGGSALAIPQYLAAGANPPHLVCGVPIVGSWNLFKDCIYQGGQYREGDVNHWINSNSSSEMYDFARENYKYADIWERLNCNTRLEYMHTPFFHVSGWYDFFFPAPLDAFRELQENGADGALRNQKIIVGPWTHTTLSSTDVGEITFPSNAQKDMFSPALGWFAYWLNDADNGVTDEPALDLYLMGPVDTTGYWNQWMEYESWDCFRDTDTLTFYLNQTGALGTVLQENSSIAYTYDPKNPVPTVGGHNLFLDAGPYDQSSVWEREDVLTFESTVYNEPYDIFGRMALKVYFSTDRTDTDITAKLVDIYPDGRKILITDGIQCARFRNNGRVEDFLTPGEIYELEVDLNYTAYTIVPGHRLGLAVSSSNYPKYAINTNSGQPLSNMSDTLVAETTIYTGPEYPARLVLPIRQSGFSGVCESGGYRQVESVITRNSIINIDFQPYDAAIDAKLYSVDSRLIDSYRLEPGQINFNRRINCQPGVYFLVMQYPDGPQVYKILHGAF